MTGKDHRWTYDDEESFRRWFIAHAKKYELPPNPDDDRYITNWRAVYKAIHQKVFTDRAKPGFFVPEQPTGTQAI